MSDEPRWAIRLLRDPDVPFITPLGLPDYTDFRVWRGKAPNLLVARARAIASLPESYRAGIVAIKFFKNGHFI